jgi:hypothetical protein
MTRKATIHLTAKGYLEMQWPQHPLVRKNGSVLLYRCALLVKLGGDIEALVACRWCGRWLSWLDGSLCVDHLDGGKQNNEWRNLSASCRACNSSRACVMRRLLREAPNDRTRSAVGDRRSSLFTGLRGAVCGPPADSP